jgi:hypothetical protein
VFDISEWPNNTVVEQPFRDAEHNGTYWVNWISFAIAARGR